MLKSQYNIPNVLQINASKKNTKVNIKKIKKIKPTVLRLPATFIR